MQMYHRICSAPDSRVTAEPPGANGCAPTLLDDLNEALALHFVDFSEPILLTFLNPLMQPSDTGNQHDSQASFTGHSSNCFSLWWRRHASGGDALPYACPLRATNAVTVPWLTTRHQKVISTRTTSEGLARVTTANSQCSSR